MSEDFLPIKGYDHVEFYVGNAKQAAHFYDKSFGFTPVPEPTAGAASLTTLLVLAGLARRTGARRGLSARP